MCTLWFALPPLWNTYILRLNGTDRSYDMSDLFDTNDTFMGKICFVWEVTQYISSSKFLQSMWQEDWKFRATDELPRGDESPFLYAEHGGHKIVALCWRGNCTCAFICSGVFTFFIYLTHLRARSNQLLGAKWRKFPECVCK